MNWNVVLLLFWVGYPLSCASQYIRNSCKGETLPLVLLRRDNVTGDFAVIKRYMNETSALGREGNYRQLQWSVQSYYLRQSNEESVPAGMTVDDLAGAKGELNQQRQLSGDINATEAPTPPADLFFARECSCLDYEKVPGDGMYYCPYIATSCGELIYGTGEDQYRRHTLICERKPPVGGTFIARAMAAKLSVVWLCLLPVALIFTFRGRSAASYIPSHMFVNWNLHYAQHILRNRPLVAQSILQEQAVGLALLFTQQSPEPTQTESDKPTSLVLRTRVWKDGGKRDEVEGEQCIICLIPFREDDRVGVLPCQHVFHADCLKLWLPRNNACPLCKHDQVATPRYATKEEEPSTTEESTESEADQPIASHRDAE